MVEINLEDPVLRGYLFYVSILVAKILCMAFLTARQRYSKKVSSAVLNYSLFINCTYVGMVFVNIYCRVHFSCGLVI